MSFNETLSHNWTPTCSRDPGGLTQALIRGNTHTFSLFLSHTQPTTSNTCTSGNTHTCLTLIQTHWQRPPHRKGKFPHSTPFLSQHPPCLSVCPGGLIGNTKASQWTVWMDMSQPLWLMTYIQTNLWEGEEGCETENTPRSNMCLNETMITLGWDWFIFILDSARWLLSKYPVRMQYVSVTEWLLSDDVTLFDNTFFYSMFCVSVVLERFDFYIRYLKNATASLVADLLPLRCSFWHIVLSKLIANLVMT